MMDTIPQEILSEIALFAATETFLGPPAGIIPLIATNRWTYSCLSFLSNPYIYAKIYESKFDLSPASRRLGIDSFSATTLAQELKRKCMILTRIRDRRHALMDSSNQSDCNETLHEFLVQIYIMVIENEGRNEQQLREYARIDEWLTEFWLDENGASAMWLYWFLLKPEQYKKDRLKTNKALDILKVYALGAHRYPLVSPSWTEFNPSSNTRGAPHPMVESNLGLKAPALSVPAILSFISLLSHLNERADYCTPLVPSHAAPPSKFLNTVGNEWECEWGRSTTLGTMKLPGDKKKLSNAFRPGSLEGLWEGIFTRSYLALRHTSFQNILVAQHKQTWKLREYHLLSPSDTCLLLGVNSDPEPVTPGSALQAYFPLGTHIEETAQGLVITEPGAGKTPLLYERTTGLQGKPLPTNKDTEDETGLNSRKRHVLDVIITGEGHSSWGEFRLIGRVRPCDGFISLSKDYVNGDRGKWLYRGYLVGNHNANLAGRWRDTLSPAAVPGYEGCFTMSRRR
ncbi:hypothetical protein BT96DRAFT_1002898 [Gymnopus androsaceus JB14]|uniref:F-box domain-containing protein n=1 Tax=Gymnopus androsaceus JB14 TaxID=1447944 RepID=A0A6A4GVB2_9AGAR|nr:hypothetical protein BT96DRAFT_1002898 [Gymnopus androsaceus JB14]